MSGCLLGDYQIALVKNGRKLSTGLSQLERIAYARVLDDVSAASVDIATTGPDCCGQLAAVDHWNTDLIIAANGNEMWRGPVRKVMYRRGGVRIEAQDMLAWLAVRILQNDLDFADADLTDIFVGVWNDAVASVDPPAAELVLYPSGVTESRQIKASQLRRAWNVAQEMLQTGLDVTTYGSRVVAGIPAFRAITMTDLDVQGSIEVVKDGDEFANRIIGDASRNLTAIYPPGPRMGSNGYPLVEDVIQDSQLSDQQSVENAAKARWDFSSRGVRRVRANGGLTLLPTAKLDHRTVIAGQLITFSATQTCYTASETLRLGRLDVVVEKGKETATIDLQPIGGVQGLDTI